MLSYTCVIVLKVVYPGFISQDPAIVKSGQGRRIGNFKDKIEYTDLIRDHSIEIKNKSLSGKKCRIELYPSEDLLIY